MCSMRFTYSSYQNINCKSIASLGNTVSCNLNSLLGLLAKIKVLGVLPAHLPLVLDAEFVLLSVPPLICAGFAYCHCTRRWAVLDNTPSNDYGAFR